MLVVVCHNASRYQLSSYQAINWKPEQCTARAVRGAGSRWVSKRLKLQHSTHLARLTPAMDRDSTSDLGVARFPASCSLWQSWWAWCQWASATAKGNEHATLTLESWYYHNCIIQNQQTQIATETMWQPNLRLKAQTLTYKLRSIRSTDHPLLHMTSVMPRWRVSPNTPHETINPSTLMHSSKHLQMIPNGCYNNSLDTYGHQRHQCILMTLRNYIQSRVNAAQTVQATLASLQ